MYEYVDINKGANIKVIGVGGGGGNAVMHMHELKVEGVEFVCANTDNQALERTGVDTTLQLGQSLTKGLGAGADPNIGEKAAEEDKEKIIEALTGTDMLFIAAGMGGGTGTGAAPVVAKIAKEMGILTVAIVTKPFPFEGGNRMKMAVEGIKRLEDEVDSLIIIPNEKLLKILGREASLIKTFSAANDVLYNAVQGIAELITKPGLINVDFADVSTVMQDKGLSMMGTGKAKGDDRAHEAAEAAIKSPLLEDISLTGATGVLVNITAGIDLSIGEFDEVGTTVKEYASDDAMIVVGTVIDEEMTEELRVTVVATGLGRAKSVELPQPTSAAQVRLVNADENSENTAQDYKNYDRPPAQRQPKTVAEKETMREAKRAEAINNRQFDPLDIPAFLRRNAD